jgi:hypothetical protein
LLKTIDLKNCIGVTFVVAIVTKCQCDIRNRTSLVLPDYAWVYFYNLVLVID